ncbi:MAG: acyltransferase family protein [Promethearchaeota archaeon]|nr:MAG: acyltransferase family protein [Candidatus Lokiarchaeota archaeon]
MATKKQASDLVLIDEERDVLEADKDHFFQIDFLKAAMIFLVIFDHIVSWGLKGDMAVELWERISIPVFLVIMGFNMGLSFKRHEANTLKDLYSWRYFKSKIIRYIMPFAILYGASTLIGLIIYRFNFDLMYNMQFSPNHGIPNLITGIMLFWGPGNWFIPVLIQSIFIMPLIYWGFTKKPILTLILCFLIEIAMQMIVFFFIGTLYPEGIFSYPKYHILSVFMNSILFYLSAVGLGMWFSFGHKLNAKRNWFIWILFTISLTYLIAYEFFEVRFIIETGPNPWDVIPLLRGDYHFLVFPYSAVLVLIIIRFLPQRINTNNRIIKATSNAISQIGKATYHILLTQILGYGIVFTLLGDHYIINPGSVPLDVLYLIFAEILFISLGVLWYKIDQIKNIPRRILYYVNFFLILAVIVVTGFNSMELINVNDVILPIAIVIVSAFVFLSVNIYFSYQIHSRRDQDKSMFRRTLYLTNLLLVSLLLTFLIYMALALTDWTPIPVGTILIYAGGALIAIFILSFVTKKPPKMITLIIWTLFLIYNFILAILYITILPPTEILIQNITIVYFAVFAIVMTILDYHL